jgi:hypothetical protein
VSRQIRLAFVCLVVAASLSGARAASFSTTLDRDTTSVGESVMLSLVFEGAQPTRVFGMPQVQGLVLQGQGSSQNVQFINGQSSVKFIYQYAVTSQQAGEFTIPSIKAEVGGQTLSSQPLRLKVVSRGQTVPTPDGAGQLAFLRLVVRTNEVFVGEVFPLEIELYVLNGQAHDLEMPQIKGDGFTFGQMPKQPSQSRTQINNNLYSVVIFKLATTAVKAGTLTLGPVECNLKLRIPRTNRRARDPFGFDPFEFFGSPFELRPTTLTGAPQTMRVLPLPTENVPPTFNGAIGEFSVSIHASPTNVAVGDPITVNVRVEGQGGLDTLSLPPQPGWSDFRIYPPTSKIETTDPLGIQGVKDFEQVVIPQNTETRELPPFTFSFFDPERRSYRTLLQPATPLTVRPTAITLAPPALVTNTGPQSPAPLQQDIVAIKQHLGVVLVGGPPWLQQPWFLALQGVPVLAWLMALVWRTRQDRLANNPRLRRQRQVAQVIREGLPELRQLAEANDAEAFFAATVRLLQEQIGERVDLPASAITEAVVEEHLRPVGLAEDALKTLHELFQVCNQARYAPQHTSQQLVSLLPKIGSALRAVKALSLT